MALRISFGLFVASAVALAVAFSAGPGVEVGGARRPLRLPLGGRPASSCGWRSKARSRETTVAATPSCARPVSAAGGRVGPLATRRAADRGPLAIPCARQSFRPARTAPCRVPTAARRGGGLGRRPCRPGAVVPEEPAGSAAVRGVVRRPARNRPTPKRFRAEIQTVSRNAYDTRRNRAGQNGDARDRQGRRQLEGGDCPLAGRGGTRRCAIARHRQREGRRRGAPGGTLSRWSASFGSSGGTRLSARCCWRDCRRWARTRARRRRRRRRGTQCSRLSTTWRAAAVAGLKRHALDHYAMLFLAALRSPLEAQAWVDGPAAYYTVYQEVRWPTSGSPIRSASQRGNCWATGRW